MAPPQNILLPATSTRPAIAVNSLTPAVVPPTILGVLKVKKNYYVFL